MVSIVIPTIEGREELLYRLLVSLPNDQEIIIVAENDMPLSQKRNVGALQATGEYILFLDDDNYIESRALDELVKVDAGIVGMIACYDNNQFIVSDGGSKRHYWSGFMRGVNTNSSIFRVGEVPYEVDEVANAFMIKRKLFFELGGFDEARFPIDLDEADLCLRAKRRGHKVVICPKAICYHRSYTYSMMPDFRRPKNAFYMGRNRVLFQKKHLRRAAYVLYAVVALPLFIISYCLCLLIRGKPGMVYHFLKGVVYGIRGSTENIY